MTPFLPRSLLALFATSALGACASPQYPITLASGNAVAPVQPLAQPESKASAEPEESFAAARPILAIERKELEPARLILAAHGDAAKQKDAPPAKGAQEKAGGRVIEVEYPGKSYTVRKGDNLRRIAAKLGVDVDELRKLNGVKGSLIHPGDVLKGPGATRKLYVVGRGDTLAGIAEKLQVSEKALRAENGLGRGGAIRAGERLKLPAAFREPAAAAAPVANASHSAREKDIASSEANTLRAPVSRAVIGRVVEVEGPPRSYKVRKGDTLNKVANKLGLSVAQLKKANGLRSSKLRVGQVLKGPRTSAKAYVVGPGDTIFSIARRFGVSVEALRAENGLVRRGSIHTGDKLRLPAGYHDRGPIITAVPVARPDGGESAPLRPEPETATPETAPKPAAVEQQAAVAPQTGSSASAASRSFAGSVAQVAAPLTDAQIMELGQGRFQWPLQGAIISAFGPKAPGQRNDGINIQASTGDPVHAAAPGEVVYAGDQVPGFGNLVLIKHADGWVTAYSHLSRLAVKIKQHVSQGQEIGQAGATGGVPAPQLHFEVRYAPSPLDRARPVNPVLVLPSATTTTPATTAESANAAP